MIVINLLPIFPLDGYKIIEDVLGNFYEDNFLYTLLNKISIFSLLVFLFITIYSKSIGLYLVFILLLIKQIVNIRQIKLKEKLKEILISNYFIFLKN